MAQKTAMRRHHPKTSSAAASTTSEANEQLTEAYRLLAEVYELLNDYAPSWYSEELSDRLRDALTPPERNTPPRATRPPTVTGDVRR
jgi:hypothetical protein